jgi:hypothetical protein
LHSTHERVPYGRTEFDLKGMKGFSIRFVMKNGKVAGATFIQPDGVYEALRKWRGRARPPRTLLHPQGA